MSFGLKIRVAGDNRCKCRECNEKISKGEPCVKRRYDYYPMGWAHVCYNCGEEMIRQKVKDFTCNSILYEEEASKMRKQLREFKKMKVECEPAIIAKELIKE